MTVQLPSLSITQQNDLINDIQTNSLFPITFQVNRLMTNPLFPTADSGGGGSYVTLTWTPTVSIAIAAITGSLFQIPAATRQVAQVSLLNTMTLGDQNPLTLPFDSGNVIYRGSFNNDALNGYTLLLPSTYYVQANVPINVFFWVETAGIGTGNTYVGAVILHTIQIGLQN